VRFCGGGGSVDINMLGAASTRYQRPIGHSSTHTLTGFFTDILDTQSTLRSAWGIPPQSPAPTARSIDWSDVDAFLGAEVPDPVLPSIEEAETLYELLCDGRPINARPPALPCDFEQLLADGLDAVEFYKLLPVADERPCSLATILSVGWQYKVRRTYPLCAELMSADASWRDAIDGLASHVLERCGLLQQSIEAAYVQEIFSGLGDR
jgi:hypothetical protein